VAGEALFTKCQACHAIDGSSGLGPALNGLYGSTVLLSSGETLIADEAYIHESIVAPQAKRSAGYAVSMPTIPLTGEQVDDLVAYIITLE
jgi:cytochrome c oxidase subunit 2